MEAVYAKKYNDNDFVVNSKFKREYSIVYDGCNFDSNVNCSIPVKSRREVELLLLCLREETSVIMNENERRLCNIWDWLYGRTYFDIFTNLNWSYRDEDEVIDIMERIPLPKTLTENLFKIHHEEPERINQVYVHKHNKENVLIAKPYHYGNMFYFNGFKKSSEFNIDQGSDHLERIIIFEAARQAGIATLHLAGIPLFYGKITLLKTNIRYKNFIERSETYWIQTIPVAKHRGGLISVVFNILQGGTSCATGYFCLSFQKSVSSSSSNWGQMFETNENVMNAVTT